MTLPPEHWAVAALALARTFGVRGLTLRAAHETRRALGAFRRTPRHRVYGSTVPRQHSFLVDPVALARATNRDPAIARADRVLRGEYQAYRHRWRPLPGNPAAWHAAPDGRSLLSDQPWWKIEHAGASGIDVKDVWEPARFAWAYDLVRAYVITRDDRYAAAFHHSLAEWCESSPPFRGVHWSCGQEVAIRAIALLYAEANLRSAPSSDHQAMSRLVNVLAASGERIADALGQAISQRNNHAISEAVGLLAIGARLRGAHPEAVVWASRGRRLLERLIREQFAEDGWYIQHSFNYLRLAVDQCLIAQRVLRAARIGLSAEATSRLRAAVELLCAVVEPESGIVPNHGHNDGAFIHPITLGAFRDYRPVITAACATFDVPLPANISPDREVLAWLGCGEPQRGDPIGDGVRSGASGWAAARSGTTTVFLRAGRYHSRPAHLDALHVDIRIDGREVIVDPGTFSYHAPPPWRNGLAGAIVHNGPLLDEEEPGIRGARFLWYRWPRASLMLAEHDGDTMVLVGEVPGRLRRLIRITEQRVIIEDQVLTPAARRVAIRWLLHPDIDPATLRIDGSRRVRVACEGDPTGWFAPHYGERIPSCYVEVEREASLGYPITCELPGTLAYPPTPGGRFDETTVPAT